MDIENPKRRIKARLIKIFSWITGISLGTALFILGAAILALAIFVRTDTFQNALRDRVLQVAKTELGASITFESAKASLFRLEPKIDFLNVKFVHAATKTSADIRRISVGISLFVSVPLLFFKKLDLSSIEVEGLAYKLESFKSIQKLLDQLRPKYDFIPRTFQTSIDRIGLKDVEVTVALPEREFYSRGLSGILKLQTVDLNLGAHETDFSGSFLLSNLTSKDSAPLNGALSIGSGTFNSTKMHFKDLEFKNLDDVLNMSGEIKRWENPILDLRGKVFAKLEHYFSDRSLSGELATDFEVRGLWNKLEGEGRAELKDVQLKEKKWQRAKGSWILKYPNLELKSFTWVGTGDPGNEDRGELTGSIPLAAHQNASFKVKVENLEFGDYIGLVAPQLSRWKGLTSGTLQYDGTIFPQLQGKFEWKLRILDYEIRSKVRDIYSFGLPDLTVSGEGDLDGITLGKFTADLVSGDGTW
ncbi:MAG: hypothetical protein JWQ35_182, partial [Bacteriovoracaceae bacterium]|nr:hypothetical protein [Bacteriovoracaceae bacterium]